MDAIFNLFKVKFTKLDQLISEHCKDITKDSKVNIFINFESVLKKLASSNIEEYLRVKTEDRSFEMISNIVNLAAHYRWFFTKNKIYSKVYIYFSFPFKSYYKNRLVNPDYRTYYEHKYSKNPNHFVLGSVLDNAIPFTKIILEYIEGVYLIQGEHLESSLVPRIITNDVEDNIVNFIVSTDKYDYQYANKGHYIIRPKQDNSYMVSKENLISTIKKEEKVDSDTDINSEYYPFILSLMGDKYRNIDKIKRVGLTNIIKMINKAKKENVIGEDVYNINILSNIIKEEFKPLVLNNFYCVDIDTQYQLCNIKDLYTITSQLVDKFDNASLKKINDEFFTNYPLYILELADANKLIKKKEKKNIFI